MRCPSCGALNADSAAWCSQCFASFEPEPPTATAHPAPPVAGADEDAPASVVTRAGDAPTTTTDARFRRSEEGVDWRCAACDTWNPLERSSCAVCGTALSETMEGPGGSAPVEEVAPAAVVAASLLLPGAGHVLLGRTAAGLGRALLYVVWAVGGVALLRAAVGADGSVLPAVPLLTGAFVLLATSLLDALALQRGATGELLSARALLWLTVGVIGLTTVALIGSALSVTR